MADKYADLSISDRVDGAVKLFAENSDLSLRKASIICDIHHSSILRRQLGITKSKIEADQERQLLTPAEEAVLKHALKYNSNWPYSFQSEAYLRQNSQD